MTFDELMTRAEEESDWEEWIGQLWLERRRILRAVNRRPPQFRHREAGAQIALLRQRVAREGTDQGNYKVLRWNRVDPRRIRERY